MASYNTRLHTLLEQIPSSVSEEELSKLEQVATEFEQILKMVHHHNSDLKEKTQYYYERITDIESGLYKAKYGRDQKQRDQSFKKTKEEIKDGIAALAKIVSDTEAPSDSVY